MISANRVFFSITERREYPRWTFDGIFLIKLLKIPLESLVRRARLFLATVRRGWDAPAFHIFSYLRSERTAWKGYLQWGTILFFLNMSLDSQTLTTEQKNIWKDTPAECLSALSFDYFSYLSIFQISFLWPSFARLGIIFKIFVMGEKDWNFNYILYNAKLQSLIHIFSSSKHLIRQHCSLVASGLGCYNHAAVL